ncbi:MAG TPA: four-carbon acid sugar kinase family protein [Gammaproteobacteria bacterium]|nr:four-carbon acid sugar kinase family protein [Gammaproteobacteria bacterium]
MGRVKIVVLDDDPTGSQTVHSCLLLTRWGVDTLSEALDDASPLLFVLTNTRSMEAAHAEAVTREVCHNLRTALAARPDLHVILVSRSDSTLRGHYPLETDVIGALLGPFDAHFLVPAFFEGGRITRDSVHYLVRDGREVPVHETEFARDSVFGYAHSYLPAYVEEKTGGRIPADRVERFLLADVRGDSLERLLELRDNACCVVDAERQSDLDRFCDQVRTAAARGKRFLFRSAASLLTSLANLPPQPVPAEAMARYVRGGRPGVVIVGSHVPTTTAQLMELLAMPATTAIEVDVERLATEQHAVLASVLREAEAAHQAGNTSVIFTTRAEKQFADQRERLAFGKTISSFFNALVQSLPADLGFLITKGGITSNDALSTGLALTRCRVLGQILPGCSVVRCPVDHPRFPELPVVIFPGNVGDRQSLAVAYARLRNLPAPL